MSTPLPGTLPPDRRDPPFNWGGRSVRDLVDHVLATHHRRSRELLGVLKPTAEQAARRFGKVWPQLPKVRDAVNLLSTELLAHLDHEERELFPLLLSREAEGRILPAIWDRETDLAKLHREHDHAEELLADLRILTQDYRLPDGADPLVEKLYENLQRLDEDLELHLEVENRWLFSRAD